jgi:hypothetical protein
MRKWICVGVLGGLLEFGIVYQVAFSGTDSPAPEAVSETDGAKKSYPRADKAGRNRRTTRHIAAAAGVAGTAASATPQAAETIAARKVTTPTSPGAPAGSTPVAAAASPATAGAGDPLGETLKTAVAAIVALPVTLGLTDTAALEPALTIPDLLEAARAEAEELAKAAPPPAPAAAPPPSDIGSLPIEDMIRHVFGPEGDKAVEVARCESTLRTHAQKGQFQGLFQLGANERADYGHGPDALAQVMAAHALFLDRGWQPWTCG